MGFFFAAMACYGYWPSKGFIRICFITIGFWKGLKVQSATRWVKLGMLGYISYIYIYMGISFIKEYPNI